MGGPLKRDAFQAEKIKIRRLKLNYSVIIRREKERKRVKVDKKKEESTISTTQEW